LRSSGPVGHELERGDGALEALAVRVRADGIPSHGDEGANLPCARLLDFLGQNGGRELAQHLVATRDAALPAAKPHRTACLEQTMQRRGRVGEHRAARPVEVARENGDEVDRPARERTEALHASAHAPVDCGRGRLGELACQTPDGLGGDPAARPDTFGGKARDNALDGVEPVQQAIAAAQRDAPFREEHVHHREQEGGVGTGYDEVMLVGARRRLAAARIHHDELAASGSQCRQALADARRRHQAAVRDHRVRAQDEQVVGSIDVGHGGAQRASVHAPRLHVAGPRIDRARREDVLRAQCARDHVGAEQRG
jgi:hypothetical protein